MCTVHTVQIVHTVHTRDSVHTCVCIVLTLASLAQLSSANGLANAESMAKLGDVIMAWGKQEKRAGLEKGSKRFDYGVNFPVAYTAAGWGVDRLSLAGLDGWKGWAGASGSMLQWHDELNITFAYTTVLPYGRVGKPRAERLMKELVRQAGGWVR